MNKKSLYNAVIASGYITTVVSSMVWITNTIGSQEDNIFMPITMLALLVLSVAVMAYLFFYEPIILLLNNKQTEAIKMFVGTITIFAALTVIFLVLAIFITL